MTGISTVNLYTFPSTFRWLESAISELDERPEIAPKSLGTVLYLGTLGFTILTIPTDAVIGFAEALFCLIGRQDFSGALSVLKAKWVKGIAQQCAFI